MKRDMAKSSREQRAAIDEVCQLVTRVSPTQTSTSYEMKADMVESFRVQREEAQKVKEEVHARRWTIETLLLVKNIADLVNSSSTSTRQALEA